MIWDGDEPSQCTFLAVGDSKLSSKWKSAWLLENQPVPLSDSQKAERLWPLRQIASYCIWAGTRYGFLVTPEEVGFVRIFYTAEDETEELVGVQWVSVPWDADGVDTLTPKLGVWAMGMLGALHSDDGRRPVFGAEKMRRIDAWYRRAKPDGTVFYEHHLTGQTRSSSNPPVAGRVVDPASQGGSGVLVDTGLSTLGHRRSQRNLREESADDVVDSTSHGGSGILVDNGLMKLVGRRKSRRSLRGSSADDGVNETGHRRSARISQKSPRP